MKQARRLRAPPTRKWPSAVCNGDSIPLAARAGCRLPPGAVLLLGHKSSHLRIDQLTVASGVTGPCVLAVSRDRFTAALVATPGAVIGSTRTLVEVGDNHAGRRSADAAGAVECAEPIPATLSGPVHRRLTANARP